MIKHIRSKACLITHNYKPPHLQKSPKHKSAQPRKLNLKIHHVD